MTSPPEVVAAREVGGFAMAAYPVTEVQFEAFLSHAEGYRNPDWWQGLLDAPPTPHMPERDERQPTCPRVMVAWVEAVAFSRWLSALRGINIRLPDEREWQLAAVGADVPGAEGRKYPWGDWALGHANTVEARIQHVVAVGLFPHGASRPQAAGGRMIHDLCGNVWDWCANHPDDVLPEGAGADDDRRAVRGGAFVVGADVARSRIRSASHPHRRSSYIGFRVVCESPIE